LLGSACGVDCSVLTADEPALAVVVDLGSCRAVDVLAVQVDPVDGGSANPYDYAYQDPLNAFDLDGQAACVWGRKLCDLIKDVRKVVNPVKNSDFSRSRLVRFLGGARTRVLLLLRSPGGRKMTRVFGGAQCLYGLKNWKKDGDGGYFFTAVGCAGLFLQ
jgi:hypothetical protein